MIQETERLKFRPWTIQDAERCFILASDEHVGPPCGWPPHKSLDETKDIMLRLLINNHTYCIINKANDEIIGNIGIDRVHDPAKGNPEGERELGFWLGYPYWNQGYMTEALEAVIEYCFQELKLSRIWCGFYRDNPASGRVQEKCGFKYQYTRREYARLIDKDVEIITNSIER